MSVRAIVTGAGSGIGRATALAIARDGAQVVAADIDLDAARRTAKSAEAGGSRMSAHHIDVTSDDSVVTFRNHVLENFGVPTVLALCAGWDEGMPFVDTDSMFWGRVVDVNYLGVVRVVHAFLESMIDAGEGGRIVAVASDAGRVGSSGEAVYAGAKGGVIAFAKSIAREAARHQITVNVVCPGPTDTPLFAKQPERLKEALIRAIPLKRLARPEEVANAISFFAAEGSAFITGQTLSVSGGLTMHG